MNIVFLSGKGGTGKTTISTNLAYLNGFNYFDCDVEEPNGHIFLNPEIEKKLEAGVLNPEIDEEKCILCNKCVSNCQFGTLANTGKKIMIFNELCHGCGTCKLSCPVGAITEKQRTIGYVETGSYSKGKFVRGILNVKEPIAVPVVQKVKDQINFKENNIVDSPPGTSCTVVETLEAMDFAVLVTEPTAFGLSDLKMAISVVKQIKIPFGVVINRWTSEDNLINDYLKEKGYLFIGKIPYNMKAAELYSEGKLLVKSEFFKKDFEKLNTELMKQVKNNE